MNIDRLVLAIAGVLVLSSVLLSIYHSPNWLWLTGVIGTMLFQSAFTGLCPMAMILKAAGVQPGTAFK